MSQTQKEVPKWTDVDTLSVPAIFLDLRFASMDPWESIGRT
jgi:hypothetical protein